MITRIKSENIVLSQKTISGYVYFHNGKITYVGKDEKPFDQEYDYGDDYVLPGMIDIHTHGSMGSDYSGSDEKGILCAIRHSVKNGATAIMPTITSSSYEQTCRALLNIEKAMQDKRYGSCIIGAHLEGPYFSLNQCGAQDKKYITEPKKEDYERIVDRFGTIIKRWDYAPERDKNGEFCEYLTKHGIVASAGHTDAKYSDMLVARDKGCRLVTHLYSCTSTITREKGYRKLGVTECAYLWDDMYTEIIADGSHLPQELLQLIFKLKPIDKIILITDSMSVTGTKEKSGKLGGTEYIIEDDVCKLKDRSAFAGSIATAETLIGVCTKAGVTINDVTRAGSENPAVLFGLNKGKIETGYDADVIVLDQKYGVKKVFIKGEPKTC